VTEAEFHAACDLAKSQAAYMMAVGRQWGRDLSAQALKHVAEATDIAARQFYESEVRGRNETL
jgi:hypothetical protein